MPVVASGSLTLVDLNDSKQLASYIGSSQSKTVIHNPNTGAFVPNYASTNQVLTPQLFVAGTATDIAAQAKSTRWFYQTNGSGAITEITASGGGYTLGAGAVKTLTITTNVLSSNTSMTYICEMVYTDPDTTFDVTAKSEIELVKVINGEKGDTGLGAITALLSNESHGIPTDSAGNSPVYTGGGTTIRLYEGTTELTYDGVGTANGTWKAVAAGTAITPGAVSDSGTFATVANPSAITADNASITYTITGKRADGSAISLTKTQTFNKIKQGVAGTTPTTYWLISSVPAVGKDKAGDYNPTSITFQAKSQTGTAAPGAYSGRFIIADSTDGTTYTDRVTSSANEATKTYSPGVNVKSIRARLYLAGGTTNLIDEQIIPVVTDGTDGIDSVIATVSTPDGNILKNSEGQLKAKVTLYKGTTEVTPSPIKWYVQDPTATTASGGDADGGNGWRLLSVSYTGGTSNYTTAELTIPAAAIAGIESFKVVATYAGKKYTDVCTVVDMTDPIQVTITGVNTFKNGVGTTTLKAILYRNGAELDAAGTEYTYTWSLYNASGVKSNTAFGGDGVETGKTITVNGTDVDVRANVICEVSK